MKQMKLNETNYFLHERSRLNLEGLLKKRIIWPCVALCKLCGLQIWGKVENSFWEALTHLTTPGSR